MLVGGVYMLKILLKKLLFSPTKLVLNNVDIIGNITKYMKKNKYVLAYKIVAGVKSSRNPILKFISTDLEGSIANIIYDVADAIEKDEYLKERLNEILKVSIKKHLR